MSSAELTPARKGNAPFVFGDQLKGGRYVVIRLLNTGGTATVYEAEDRHNPGTHVALKAVNAKAGTNTPPMHLIKREIALASSIDHPRVVRLLDVFAEGVQLCLVLELVRGPDLLDLLNECGGIMPEDMAAYYLRQVIQGILVLHSRGMCHRDIKPENVVVERATWQSKIVDFGLAKRIETAETLQVGTPDYMAPELLLGGPYTRPLPGRERAGLYDARKVDAWAVGVMAFLLCTGKYPFEDPENRNNSIRTVENIRANRRQPFPSNTSIGLRLFIDRLLSTNPEMRPPLDVVYHDTWLNHNARAYARYLAKVARHSSSEQHIASGGDAAPSPPRHRAPSPAPPRPLTGDPGRAVPSLKREERAPQPAIEEAAPSRGGLASWLARWLPLPGVPVAPAAPAAQAAPLLVGPTGQAAQGSLAGSGQEVVVRERAGGDARAALPAMAGAQAHAAQAEARESDRGHVLSILAPETDEDGAVALDGVRGAAGQELTVEEERGVRKRIHSKFRAHRVVGGTGEADVGTARVGQGGAFSLSETNASRGFRVIGGTPRPSQATASGPQTPNPLLPRTRDTDASGQAPQAKRPRPSSDAWRAEPSQAALASSTPLVPPGRFLFGDVPAAVPAQVGGGVGPASGGVAGWAQRPGAEEVGSHMQGVGKGDGAVRAGAKGEPATVKNDPGLDAAIAALRF